MKQKLMCFLLAACLIGSSLSVNAAETESLDVVQLSETSAEEPSEESTPAESTEQPSEESTPAESTEQPSEESTPAESTEQPSEESTPAESTEQPSEESTPAESTEQPSEESTPAESTEQPSEESTPAESTEQPSEESTPAESTEQPSEEITSEESQEETSETATIPETETESEAETETETELETESELETETALEETEMETEVIIPEEELQGATQISGGSSMSGATGISLDSEYVSNIQSGTGSVYYKFTTGSASAYTYIYYKNISIDAWTTVYVYNSIGEQVERMGNYYQNSEMNLYLKLERNSTYYILVEKSENFAGNIRLSVSQIADPEGNTSDEAYSLSASSLYRGSMAASGDVDYYSIRTSAAGHYKIILHNESASSYLNCRLESVYGENLEDRNYIYSPDSYTMEITLEANTTYYFRVWNYSGSGSYTVQYSYVEDKEGDTTATAYALGDDTSYGGSISSSIDVDYFKVVPSYSGRYCITLSNRSSDRLNWALYTVYNERIVYNDRIYSGKTETTTVTLQKGTTYYLYVYGEVGNYSVRYYKDFPFTDVAMNEGNWKYDSVNYVYENNIMNGINGTTNFNPDEPLTRAMFVTVLYRMAGEPYVSFDRNRFDDVTNSSAYYAKAVIWANDKGIVQGYEDGNFGININITREQVAKMLYKYAEVQGYNVSARANLNSFPDRGQVSSWATEFMRWAVAKEMITGKNMEGVMWLAPKGEATRAECAAMITRFLKTL